MICREGADSYSIHSIGREINIESMTGTDLVEYLTAIIHNSKQLWTDDQIEGVLYMDVGENTPVPYGAYR